MRKLRREGGFAYIAAVILLVVIAGVIAGMLRLTAAQQGTANDALLIARAGQAARAGVEWGMYRVRTLGACPAAATNLADFRAASGFTVTVNCSLAQYNEGQDPASGDAVVKNVYRIDAIACNGTGAGANCPDNANAAAPDYIERRRVATMCILADKNYC